jgi:hypothetical protein
MTHSLDQKVVARKAKARKCAAEVAGNVQAKTERQYRLVNPISFIPPARNNPQRYTRMCAMSPHNSTGMVSLVWFLIVKLSPAPNDMFA